MSPHPGEDPISLMAAIVFAAIGLFLFVFIVVKLTREYRQKKAAAHSAESDEEQPNN